MNRYLEKIAQGFSQLDQPKKDSSGTAKTVGVGAATLAGGAAGMAAGRKAATSSPVQSKIKDRAANVGDRSASRVKERAGRRINAQREEIKKLDKVQGNQSAINSAGKKKELRQSVIRQQQEKVRKAGTKAGRTAKANKFITRATGIAKKKLGRAGGVIGAGVALGASGAASLSNNKTEG